MKKLVLCAVAAAAVTLTASAVTCSVEPLSPNSFEVTAGGCASGDAVTLLWGRMPGEFAYTNDLGTASGESVVATVDQLVMRGEKHYAKVVAGSAESAVVEFTMPRPVIGSLPDHKYMRAEYVQSSGSQYILTGVKGGRDIDLHYEFSTLSMPGTVVFFGDKFNGGNPTRAYMLYTYSSNFYFCGDKNFSIVANTRYVMDVTGSTGAYTVQWNDKTSSGKSSNLKATVDQLAIFGSNAGESCSSYRLHEFKLTQSGAVVRDFVPAYDLETQQLGLFDLAGGDAGGKVFYVPEGGKALSAKGDDVLGTDISLEIASYPEAYGTAYPDYGVHQYLPEGETYDCFVPPVYTEGTKTATIKGWKLYAYGEDGSLVETANGDGNVCRVAKGTRGMRVVWQWSVQNVPGVAAPTVESTTATSFTISANVTGIGLSAASGDVKVVWGDTSETLNRTNDVCTVTEWTHVVKTLSTRANQDVYAKVIVVSSDGVGESGVVRVAMPAASVGSLPGGEYMQVKYIQSDAKQYIKTGVTGGSNLDVSMGFTTSGSFPGQVAIFASDWNNHYRLYFVNPGIYVNGAKSCDMAVGKDYDIVWMGSSDYEWYTDGVLTSASKSGAVPSATGGEMAIFGTNAGGNKSNYRLRYFKMTLDGVLVRDFVPCYRVSDGMMGLYDLAAADVPNAKVFYPDENGNNFVAKGEDVPSDVGTLTVVGVTSEIGVPDPAYGDHAGIPTGNGFVCAAPATVQEGERTAVCVGWTLYEKDAAGDWVQKAADDTNVCPLVMGKRAMKLEWKWLVRDALKLGNLSVAETNGNSFVVNVPVLGIGLTATRASVKFVYGLNAANLDQERLVDDNITATDTYQGVLPALLPGRVYYVKAVATNDQRETFETPVMTVVAAGTEGAGGGASERSLPSGYVRVLYVQGDASRNPYINTGIYPDANTEVEAEVGDIFNNFSVLFGQEHDQRNWQTDRYALTTANGGFGFEGGSNSGSLSVGYNTTHKYCITVKNGNQVGILDHDTGVSVTKVVTVKTQPNKYLYLCGEPNGFHPSTFKLYSFKIWQEGLLVRDFIPAREEATLTYGLYDLEGGKFYASEAGANKQFAATPLYGRRILTTAETPTGVAMTVDPGEGETPADLYRLTGAVVGGAGAEGWDAVEKVGTIAVGTTEASDTLPDGWGTDAFAARYFTVVDGCTNFSECVFWHDATLPYLGKLSADGTGGDTIRLAGTLDSFVGASCTLRAYVGASPETLTTVWDNLDGGVRTAAGAYELTLFTADLQDAKYIHGGETYYIEVEGVDENGKISRSPLVKVETKAEPTFSVTVNVAVDRRTITLTTSVMDLGANPTNRVSLWAGTTDGEDSFVKVSEDVIVTNRDAFSIGHAFESFLVPYRLQLRAAAEAAGKTATWTAKTPVRTVTTQDTTTYVWTGAANDGVWSTAGNWSDDHEGDAYGWPASTDATAVFPDGDWQVALTQSATVKAMQTSAATFLALTGATRDTALTLKTLPVDCLKSDNGALTLRNVTLAVDSAVHSKLQFGANEKVTVDDATFTCATVVSFGVTGGARRTGLWLQGESPRVSAVSLCTTYSETEYPGSRCPVHFVIPENGYAVAPVVGISVGSPWDKPFFTKASVTGVTDNPGLIFVEKSSPVFRKRQILDVPLFSVANKISYNNVEFSPLRNPDLNFFYWSKTGSDYNRTAISDQGALSVHIEGGHNGLQLIVK